MRGAESILHCNHRPLEPFIPEGIKIPKLNRLSVEVADYSITFVNITGKYKVLADATSRLKTLDIYKEAMEKTKTTAVSNMREHVMEIHATNMHILNTIMLCTEQKWT